MRDTEFLNSQWLDVCLFSAYEVVAAPKEILSRRWNKQFLMTCAAVIGSAPPLTILLLSSVQQIFDSFLSWGATAVGETC